MAASSSTTPDFRALFETAPGLYLVLDPNLTIVAVNDAYCRATMTSRGQILGCSIFDVFPDNPNDPSASGVSNLTSSFERVLQLRLPDAMATQKYDIQRPESEGGGFEERYWDPVNIPVLGADGEVGWILHRVEDVTELVRLREEGAAQDRLVQEQLAVMTRLRETNQKLALQIEENERLERERSLAQAEQHRVSDELRESEARFRALSDNLPGVIYRRIMDREGEFRDVYISSGIRRMLGVEPDEILERKTSLLEFVHPDDRERKLKALHAAAAKRETLTIEVRKLARPDGAIRWWQIHTTPEALPNGDVQWDGVALDITDRKNAQEQLQQALKMEAIGQLTGGIAHDFNNLLTVILANAEILEEELVAQPQLRGLAEMVRTAAERGASLTNGLLAFARRQALEPRAVDVNRLVAEMDGLVRRTIGEQIEIEVVRGAGLWEATADPGQLESVLLNLAINARDAMISGGKLTIETANAHIDSTYSAAHDEVSPGQYILLAVSDTGTGMSREVIARAFEPFFTTKGPGKGTGLGLSMVFGFVKQSGGHVKIYSELGHGTTIKIYLPRAYTGAEVKHESPSNQVEPKGQETILLVEDDALVRKHVEGLLGYLGYNILSACDGPEALKLLETPAPIDLLFTDIVMPGGMNGRQLAERAVQARPKLKVLFTSGYTENAIVHHGRLDPGVHLLRKPYRRQELAMKLRELLEPRRPR